MADLIPHFKRLAGPALLLAAALAVAAPPAGAAPANPKLREHTQSDGIKVAVRQRGDEYHHWSEDRDGYTVMKGPDGRDWFYAEKDAGGALRPGPHRAGSADPEKLGVKKSLKDERRAAAARQRRSAENAARRRRAAASPFRVSAQGGAAPASATGAAPARTPILSGTMKNLVVLAKFSDQNYTYSQSMFNNLFNQIGYTYDGAWGSLKDYYLEVSYGNLTVDSVVTAWVTLPYNEYYYGANDAYGYDVRPREMVQHALAALEAGGFDFRQVDGNSDGQIDGLTIIHSGYGEEASYGAAPDAIWSHQWELASPVIYDGVTIQNYHTEAEKRGTPGYDGIARIGVIAHETGHFLGLPDLYDADGGSSGLGAFCLMSGGTWNGPAGDGESPSHPSAACKKELGWATATLITTDGLKTIGRIYDDPAALYKLHGGAGWSVNEYFLVENRQGVGFDTYLPGSMRGLLIWHVDESQPDNTNPARYLVDLEEANGTQQLELSEGVYGDDGDYFRGGYRTSFNDTTTPNSKSYLGVSLNYPISAVSATGNSMTFYVGTLDVSSPTAPATVYDGTETGVDIDGTASRTQLSANWTASSDGESGISAYYYAIGTAAGLTNVAGWTSNGTSRSTTTLHNPLLSIGTTYYFGVKALNGAGLYSPATWSDGQVITETLPEAVPYINDGTGADLDYVRSLSSLSANWGASPSEGVTDYRYAIGTTPGGAELVGWTSTGTVRAVTRTGLALSQATTYYFSVKCKTNGNYSAAAVSDGQKTDTVAPAARVESLSLPSGGTGAFTAKLIVTDANGISGTPSLNFTDSAGRVVPLTPVFLFSSTWTVSGNIESYYSTGTASFHLSAADPAGNTASTLSSGGSFTINYGFSGAAGGSVRNSDSMGVTLPAGAAAGTVFVSVSTVPAASVNAADLASPDSRKISSLDLARDFSARDAAGAAVTSFSSPVTITMSYPDADGDGRIDGDLVSEDLAWIYYLDSAAGRWTPLADVDRNPAANTLTAEVSHFSVYSVRAAGSTSPGLGALKAYPNPCDFRSSPLLKIAGIPPDAATPAVDIYNSAGELVRTLARGDGIDPLNVAAWDGRAGGGKAASGIYIYVVRTANYGKGRGKFYVVW